MSMNTKATSYPLSDVDELTFYIKSLKSFAFSQCETFTFCVKSLFASLTCHSLPLFTTFSHRELQFKRSQSFIDDKLDLPTLFKRLQRIDFLEKIVLSKYQSHLLPYVSHNVIPSSSDTDTHHITDDYLNDKQLRIYVSQLVMREKAGSKVDRRLIKQIKPGENQRGSKNSGMAKTVVLGKYLEQIEKSVEERDEKNREEEWQS